MLHTIGLWVPKKKFVGFLPYRVRYDINWLIKDQNVEPVEKILVLITYSGPRRDKSCLRFPTKRDSTLSPQLQRPARKLKIDL